MIHITLQLNKRANLKHKGYFLLTAKEPFAEDDLEFRSVMMSWSHYLERRELLETWRKKAKGPEEKQSVQERLDQLRGSSPGLANVENIQLLDFDRKGDHQVSMVSLPKEVALRSYLVYDFKPWGGAMVMDGGLWLTYDLPSIIRAQLDSN